MACVSRGTRRGLDFELREPNPKSKLGCNVWQFPAETNTNIFFCRCVLLNHFRLAGKEAQSWILCFIDTTRPFSINYSISNFNAHSEPLAGKITTLFFFLFKSTATEQVVCSKNRVSERITRHNLTLLYFHSFQIQFSFKCWKPCTWPGSFFPRSLWGGEIKDPGNEAAKSSKWKLVQRIIKYFITIKGKKSIVVKNFLAIKGKNSLNNL